MELIEGIAIMYELNETLDEEELEDLLLDVNPIFPEDIPKLEERMNFITFKKWLDNTLTTNINAINENNIDVLIVDEYEQLLIKLQKFNMKFNHILTQDSIDRFNKILDITKEEYKIISSEKNKDIVFYNRLLGWYESNFDEITLFATNLKLIN